MRPFKHVARTSGTGDPVRYENILGIDLARFQAPWGEVPIVATTEADRVTLYYWNARDRRWEVFEREHQPLTVGGTTPDGPNVWNWSDRVAVACSPGTVHVVYKRATLEGTNVVTALVHDRYRPQDPDPLGGNQRLERVDSSNIATDRPGRFEIGRALWATCDRQGALIILYQTRSRNQLQPDADWSLSILKLLVDPLTGATSLQSGTIGDGGFDLDARLDGDRLLAVYRRTPEAFRIPFLMTLGGSPLSSGEDADPFYEPLQLATVDLTTLSSAGSTLPGGQHPQLQRADPLLITFDRPSRLVVTLATPAIPLPPARPSVFWEQGATDKIAVLRSGTQLFRGTLLTSDGATIPHSHATISRATLLFDDQGGLLTHAAPFRNFLVSVLTVNLEPRRLTLDVLHHRDHLGLYRTRLRARLENGAILVEERSFEVWDIGHAQIEDPDDLEPPSDAENDQFLPTRVRPISAAPNVQVAAVGDDNTIGGHLVADLTREPVGFFAYTDLGDGGLRVIYAPDLAPLAEPPPIENEKVLRPEQVTGPHIPCDIWVELTSDDWTDGELPGYSVGLINARRALGSAMEVPIDFLIDTAAIVSNNPGGEPIVPSEGMSTDQLTAIDTFRAGLAPPPVFQLPLTDGRIASVTVTPAVFVTGVSYTLTAQIAGNTPAQAFWTTALLDGANVPVGPLLPGDILGSFVPIATFPGNPVTLTAPAQGNYRLSVFFPPAVDGRPPGASVNVNVVASTYEMLEPLYDGIADGDMYRIGDLDLSLLQSDIRYSVPAIGDDPSNIRIAPRNRTMKVRFVGGDLGQGTIESRQTLSFSSDDVRLENGLDLLFNVDSFNVSLSYGRPYTPGILLREQRSRDILDGRRLNRNATDVIRRDDPTMHAALAAKPYGDAFISSDYTIHPQISMAPGGFVVSALIAALLMMGAAAVVTVIVGLSTALLIALAAGPLGAVAAALALAALTAYIIIEAPKVAERFATAQVEEMITSGALLARLNDQPLARYSGEGTAEAIARKALVRARGMELPVPDPGIEENDFNFLGLDRMRGQLFQMVFVTDGICRVLLRIDDCVPGQTPGIDPPIPPDDDDDHGGPPGAIGARHLDQTARGKR